MSHSLPEEQWRGSGKAEGMFVAPDEDKAKALLLVCDKAGNPSPLIDLCLAMNDRQGTGQPPGPEAILNRIASVPEQGP